MSELKCHKCGYVWDYKGKLATACCPNCQSKVKARFKCYKALDGGKQLKIEGE